MPKDFKCPECGKDRKNARADASVCSAGCRIKKLRRINKESLKKTAGELTINKKGDK